MQLGLSLWLTDNGMDLRAYYKKRREIEKGLAAFVVVKSLATPDGGVAGRLTEVTAAEAARMIADGAAEAAPKEETEAYRRKLVVEKEREERKRASMQVQVTLTDESRREIQGMGRAERKE